MSFFKLKHVDMKHVLILEFVRFFDSRNFNTFILIKSTGQVDGFRLNTNKKLL